MMRSLLSASLMAMPDLVWKSIERYAVGQKTRIFRSVFSASREAVKLAMTPLDWIALALAPPVAAWGAR